MAIRDETMPILAVVYCDRCGIEVAEDYLVPAGMDSLAVARNHVRRNCGWSVDARGDFCPQCTPSTPEVDPKAPSGS